MVLLAGETRAGGDPSSYTTTELSGYESPGVLPVTFSQFAPRFGFTLPAIDLSKFDFPTPTLPDIALPDLSLPTKEDILTPIAETTFDVLDPYYGEGGVLEPVTVVVDPERTVEEEYLEPIQEKWGDEILLGAGLLALLLLRK